MKWPSAKKTRANERKGAFDQNFVTRCVSGNELFFKEPKFDKIVVP